MHRLKRGLLAPETWHCNRPHINLKTIDVPLLGTVTEQNRDGCLEDSLMPVGWPLHLDGAVKQRCLHRTTTLCELDELLQAYDMKRNLVELNYEAAQWKHKTVWTRKYMEAKRGHGLLQMWNDHEIDITITTEDILRAVSAAARKPSPRLSDSQFLRAPGTDDVCTAPPQTSALSLSVKTRERRGSSFSQLGLEPNHTGLIAQSLFFLEESCRVKRSDTQTFSNFSNYFKRVLKLQKRSSSFSK